jgi:hypothetical protein
MAQINIMDHVVYPDGSTAEVHAFVTHEGCTVTYAGTETNITWEQMGNVEQLSEMFAEQTVRVFKVIVQLLGRIYSGKDAYKLVV